MASADTFNSEDAPGSQGLSARSANIVDNAVGKGKNGKRFIFIASMLRILGHSCSSCTQKNTFLHVAHNIIGKRKHAQVLTPSYMRPTKSFASPEKQRFANTHTSK